MILSGRDLQLYIQTGKLKIDPIEQNQFQQNGVDLIMAEVKHMHGPFWLGCTKEVIELPDDLMAFVEIRSTWARKGFFLPPTIVDAGFKGNLTLEILCHAEPTNGCIGGDAEAAIGERFAHLIFAKTSGPCEKYSGKYTDQRGITEAK